MFKVGDRIRCNNGPSNVRFHGQTGTVSYVSPDGKRMRWRPDNDFIDHMRGNDLETTNLHYYDLIRPVTFGFGFDFDNIDLAIEAAEILAKHFKEPVHVQSRR